MKPWNTRLGSRKFSGGEGGQILFRERGRKKKEGLTSIPILSRGIKLQAEVLNSKLTLWKKGQHGKGEGQEVKDHYAHHLVQQSRLHTMSRAQHATLGVLEQLG